MKRNFKKAGWILVVVIMLILSTTATVFAEDTTTTGEGDASTPIPIEGTIEALTVSVTHPITVSYAIDPNDGNTEGIIAPEILLVNNTLVPIKVTVESMFSTSGGSLQFTDVLPADKDWANLNVADSKQFIALGIKDTKCIRMECRV